MANRICVANNKGGVAKSTTSINLAAGLAQRGRKVLLLDMDPSAGASIFFGLAVAVREEREQIYSTTDLLLGKPFAPQRKHLLAGLDLLPATKRLAYLADDLSKKDLSAADGGVRLLAESLARVEMEYDYVIIDTQPTLNRLLIMALLAAPNIIAPVQADIGNVPMTMDFHDSIRGLQRLTQPELRLLGVLPTFFNSRAKTPHETVGLLGKLFGEEAVFATRVSRRQSIADAHGYGKPIIVAAPSDPGAREYSSFTEEVIRRVEG
ncbi:ParA family protein [Vitiosangium sp. GDMCC 1.1324]|uniref:ParA family protein n=1 Tax=Vitiosangium sp. (strain GDMCC 1.1324) TaxID=2138576 RepID=UPI00130E06EB|nr:ParA family protein [Vitiosangium sp. GDMCC 1.1324]